MLAIDHDPEVVRDWQSRGVDAIYGDVTDPEYLTELPLAQARWVVSTLRHHGPYLYAADPRQTLLKVLHAENFEGKTAIAIFDPCEASAVSEGGADLVLDPYVLAAEDLVEEVILQ